MAVLWMVRGLMAVGGMGCSWGWGRGVGRNCWGREVWMVGGAVAVAGRHWIQLGLRERCGRHSGFGFRDTFCAYGWG